MILKRLIKHYPWFKIQHTRGQSLQTIASSIFHGDFDENVSVEDSNLGSEDSNLGFDPNPTERELFEEIVYSPQYNQDIASPLENTGKILGRILIKLAHDERITLTSRSATVVTQLYIHVATISGLIVLIAS